MPSLNRRPGRTGTCAQRLRCLVVGVVVTASAGACGSGSGAAAPRVPESGGSDQSEQSAYPVSWEATLLSFAAPRTFDGQLQSSLAAALDAPWETPMQVTNGHDTAEVPSCRALLGLAGTYEPAVASDFATFQDLQARCRAVALLAEARPSKVSWLHAFALDEQAPSRLPAEFAFAVSPEDDQRVTEASSLGKPWSAIESVHLLEQASPRQARYSGDASEQNLAIVGYADVNGDGVEDLLVLSHGRLTEGSLKSTRLLVITQDGPDQPTTRLLPIESAGDHGQVR